ncbi:D-amino-acid oxidase [Penicillium chermesinum]|nr:D-amino-acid oxidase [Penicillium chermesinum]
MLSRGRRIYKVQKELLGYNHRKSVVLSAENVSPRTPPDGAGPASPNKHVVVVGAGVIGLTTALLLSELPGYSVIVMAKHMPGDIDIEYASPMAGACFMPFSAPGTDNASWDGSSWYQFKNLALNHPEAGVSFQEAEVRLREEDLNHLPHKCAEYSLLMSSSYAPPMHKNPPGIVQTTTFKTLVINPSVYLAWLVARCIERGVVFQRKKFEHIIEVKLSLPHDSVFAIVNCTGLGAASLGGVDDLNVIPTLQQFVVVSNEASKLIFTSGSSKTGDEMCSVMNRPAGGGTILAGPWHLSHWYPQVDPNAAIRIMEQALELDPSLNVDGKGIGGLNIMSHEIGITASRPLGTRVQMETLFDTWLIHNYGHGAAGFQNSFGAASACVNFINNNRDIDPLTQV